MRNPVVSSHVHFVPGIKSYFAPKLEFVLYTRSFIQLRSLITLCSRNVNTVERNDPKPQERVWIARISFQHQCLILKSAGLMHSQGTTDEQSGDIKASFFQ